MMISSKVGFNLTRYQSRLGNILEHNISPRLLISRCVASKPDHDISEQSQQPTKKTVEIISSRKLFQDPNDDEPKSLFPLIEKLDLVTKDREHTLKMSCDKVISLINLGAINKNIAVQYYHYLVDIAKKSDSDSLNDRQYLLDKIKLLQGILLKREIGNESKQHVLSDPSCLTEEICSTSCKLALENQQLWKSLPVNHLKRLLGACLAFQNWDLATMLLAKRELEPTIPKESAQIYADALKIASLRYTSDDMTPSAKKALKISLMNYTIELFRHFKISHTTFEVDSRQEFVDSLSRFDYNIVQGPRIKSSGLCGNCNTTLPSFDDDQLLDLHTSINELLSTKYNHIHHLNASPGEVDRFQNFIKMINGKKPIDCVIDGLNIAMRHNDAFGYKTKVQGGIDRHVRRQNPASSVVMLVNTILRCNMLEKFNSIILIGKQHMYSWPGLVEFLQKSDIAFFFSKDHSKDDLFMLYAATLNPNTTMISCDLFRDHAYRLEGKQKLIFERWQDTHQGWINSRSLEPHWPTNYHKLPYHDDEKKSLHIPLVERAKSNYALSVNGPPPYLNPKALFWICCKPNK